MTFDSNRRRALKVIGGAGLFLAAGGAGAASAAPPRDGDTIVDVASGTPGFETLVAAVQEAGLVDALGGNRQVTVFAPTNAAFAELGVTADNVGDVDFEAAVGSSLTEILTYHVVPGRRAAASVLPVSTLPTLNGTQIDVDGAVLNGTVDIVDTDVPASNGVVHVVDAVLIP